MSASDPLTILKEFYGYGAFRGAQAEIIDHVIAGQDAFVLMLLNKFFFLDHHRLA